MSEELRTLQRWFAHVVEHPGVAATAVRSKAAQELVPLAQLRAGLVVRGNPRMTATDQLQVYNGGYLARLREVLQEDFGAVRHAVGEVAFDRLVVAYLQRHPSRTPTLNRLGDAFAAFVRGRRQLPQRAFVAELAALELAVNQSFDAPHREPLSAERLGQVPSWEKTALVVAPSVRLLATRHPVDAWYQTWKERGHDAPRTAPAPLRSGTLVFRRDGSVFRQRLAARCFAVLRALCDGQSLQRAVAHARPGDDVGGWFADFQREGLFVDLVSVRSPR